MIILRLCLVFGAVALSAAILWALGADTRGLGPVIVEMLHEPWSLVTLLDLYLGFFIAAIFVVFFERSHLWSTFWAVPIFFLGNVWTALWVVIRLPIIASKLSSGN
ncbi:MAG: DUF1475 family protein [Pseudomonadota bacterium]